MSILVDKNTRVIVQGITGRQGMFHAKQMLDYGTTIVGGVTPGRGGTSVMDDIPVFDSVKEAVKETEANASIIYVPASGAADTILEAAHSEIPLIICITEGVPTKDMIGVSRYVREAGVTLIGPNCPGIISPLLSRGPHFRGVRQCSSGLIAPLLNWAQRFLICERMMTRGKRFPPVRCAETIRF